MANLKYKHTAYTSAQWASLNPVIVENEIVIESDTKRTKIGNGISTYNQLEYADANSIGNSLGSIKPTDAAPTPARNGNYTFSIGGNKPAWLTAEAGVTTVKAGDGVAVVYTAPSSYTYTHVDVSSEFALKAKTDELTNTIFKINSAQFNDFLTDGLYISGVYNTSNVWKSKTIDVLPGDIIQYSVFGNTTTMHLVTFLNASNAIVSSILANGSNTYVAQSGTVTTPIGATKAVITTFATQIINSFYKILIVASDTYVAKSGNETIEGKKTFSNSPSIPMPLSDADATPKSFVTNLVGKNYFTGTVFDTNGVYLNGVWTVSANWKSKTIDILPGKTIEYRLYSDAPAALITFLNSSNVIISTLDSLDTTIDTVQTGTSIVPANATKAVITTHDLHVLDSWYIILIDNTDLFVKKTTIVPKTYIVDKTKTLDVANYTYPTIAGALAVATGIDTIKIFGSESSPYNEFHLTLPDGITIIGIGTPWVKGEQLASETVDNILNLSTFEAYNGFTLENLLITCKNARYPIHADFSNGNTIKNIRNCRFIHYGNKEAYDYQVANSGNPSAIVRAMSAWGGGTKAGDRVYIDGCYFESPMRAFSTHNNADFNLTNGASIVKVSNSKMVSHGIDRDGSNLPFLVPIHIQSLTSNANDQVIFENCSVNGYITLQNALTQDIVIDTKGLKQVANLAGSGLSIIEDWVNLDVTKYVRITSEISSFKNMNAGTLIRGKAVKRSGIGIDLFTSADSITDFLGILMQDVDSGKAGDVKIDGYLPWKYFTGVAYSIADGADVSVDATGSFIQNSTHVVCKAVDNNNILID